MCVAGVCIVLTGSMNRTGKETWRALEPAIETREKDYSRGGGGGGKGGRRWRGKAVTDNIVVLKLPQGQTRRRERKSGNET